MNAEPKNASDITGRFEPKIVAFLCLWCSYTGADLAGTARMKYPPNVVPIRVMCSGRIDPEFIFKAFAEGADGVAVCGCHPGDCHYIEGNFKTMARMPIVSKYLQQMGIEPERFRLEWISAAEGEKFMNFATEMTDEVRRLGPLNWKATVNAK
ncbi:MAG: hydrogenase iron-sulfur subunit [bacterium]